MMINKKVVLFAVCVFLWCAFTPCPHNVSGAAASKKPRLGVWITVFSPEKVLYSKKNVDRLIRTCTDCDIDDIYIQVYRADEAYYNSDLTDRSPYEAMLAGAGTDTLAYLIDQANNNGLKVHAWLNLLSIAQNENANILKKLGTDALTLDQHGRTSMQKGNKDKLDSYYIRENQLFLEAGDSRVKQYLTDIAEEVVRKYPGLAGMHLDYIRYPVAVPFIPGSKFTSHGLSYGYTRRNTRDFKRATGINARNIDRSRKNFGLWDDWRRDKVTELVRDISGRVREISPDIEISCTTVPSIERSYLVTFQNWTRWLRDGITDRVVIMNYTDNTELMELNTGALYLPGMKDKIYMGIGAYLVKDRPGILEAQITSLVKLSPAGITIFSYDEIANNEKLQNFLARTFKRG